MPREHSNNPVVLYVTGAGPLLVPKLPWSLLQTMAAAAPVMAFRHGRASLQHAAEQGSEWVGRQTEGHASDIGNWQPKSF